MSILQEIQKQAIKQKRPEIRPGYTVRVHQKIKEGEKDRVQIFEGLVIKLNSGHGADKTFTVRKIVEGIGVEKIFPLYSPRIEKIEVKKESTVRRAKLYYMRGRSGKSARLKGNLLSGAAAEVEAPAAESPEVAAAAEAAEPAAESPEVAAAAEPVAEAPTKSDS